MILSIEWIVSIFFEYKMIKTNLRQWWNGIDFETIRLSVDAITHAAAAGFLFTLLALALSFSLTNNFLLSTLSFHTPD